MKILKVLVSVIIIVFITCTINMKGVFAMLYNGEALYSKLNTPVQSVYCQSFGSRGAYILRTEITRIDNTTFKLRNYWQEERSNNRIEIEYSPTFTLDANSRYIVMAEYHQEKPHYFEFNPSNMSPPGYN